MLINEFKELCQTWRLAKNLPRIPFSPPASLGLGFVVKRALPCTLENHFEQQSWIVLLSNLTFRAAQHRRGAREGESAQHVDNFSLPLPLQSAGVAGLFPSWYKYRLITGLILVIVLRMQDFSSEWVNPQLLLPLVLLTWSHAEGLATAASACYVRVVEHELTRQLGFCIVHLCSQYRHLSFLVYQHCGPILKGEIVWWFTMSQFCVIARISPAERPRRTFPSSQHMWGCSSYHCSLSALLQPKIIFSILNRNITDFLIPWDQCKAQDNLVSRTSLFLLLWGSV